MTLGLFLVNVLPCAEATAVFMSLCNVLLCAMVDHIPRSKTTKPEGSLVLAVAVERLQQETLPAPSPHVIWGERIVIR